MRTILALAVILAAGAAAAQGPAPAPAGDAVHGKQLFMAVGCYQCHGTSGEGGSDRTAPRIAPGLIAYPFFVNQLRSPQQRMPLYTAVVLPDKDVADIYAYLKTVPPAKKLADIPLLNQ